MLKQIVSLTAGVLLALVIATCGGDDEKQSSADTQPTEAAVETITVRETEFELDPANPRIEQTGLVNFRVENEGGAVHALEIEGPEGESKTEDIQPGESTTLRANLSKSGTYEWYCPVGNHRDLGMEGEITVGGGSSQTGTTTTDTTETNTTTTNETTTTTERTPTEPGNDSGGSGSGSGGSGSGGSGSGGSGSGSGSGSGGSGY